ncbi:hypothetical protein TNCV_2194101 [Trichonephila clavipes]|uniref:Uncharacterized protein n=1 Tax=Trichonephila clavipes TaxID=2585209 RepID=A0A8X6SBU0_TRICX|nr:hypothetical protein TNCV_2194101 [Trichonephila clavipes]
MAVIKGFTSSHLGLDWEDVYDSPLLVSVFIKVNGFTNLDLTLPRAPKPNRHSRDLLYAISSYDIVAVNFLLHENPPALAGVKPATFGADGHLDKPK